MSPNIREEAGTPARRLDRERLRRFLSKHNPRAAMPAAVTTTPPDQKAIVAIPPGTSNPTKRKRSDSFCENCECAKCEELKPPAKRKKLDGAPPSSTAKDFIAKMDQLKTLLDDEQMDGLHPIAAHSTAPVVVQDSTFLDLPPEIRNRIYRHALCPESPNTPLDIGTTRIMWHQKPRLTQPHNLAVGLLRTCKQVHQEAGSILYSENVFRGKEDHLTALVYDQGSMVSYIRQLSITDADISISLTGKSFDGYPALTSLEDLPHLRKLVLHISEGESEFRGEGMGSREISRAIFWELIQWIDVKKKQGDEVDIFGCIQVVPGQCSFDQDIFHEEFSYFLASYSTPPKLPNEATMVRMWRMREDFLREVDRRIKSLEG